MTRILVPYHMDEHLPDLDVPLQPDVTVTAELPEGDTWQRMAHLYERVRDLVADDVVDGKLPVVMSADCTAALGTMAGAQRAGSRPAVVWFDAHGDVQTLETTTSGYLGGMPLRLLIGYRPELIATALGLNPVHEDQVVLAGGRDLDPPEVEFLAGSAITHCAVDDVAADVIPEGPLLLHVDLDVTDPGDISGLVLPTPDGPGLGAVAAAIGRVLATGRVVAVSFGCTWHPGQGAADQVRPHLEGIFSS